jgi:hypothetical protein
VSGGTRTTSLVLAGVIGALLAGCGGGGGSGTDDTIFQGLSQSTSAPQPKTLEDVRANLEAAGYRLTVYTPHEGALTLADVGGKPVVADAGLSIDYGPDGTQLYGSVYEFHDPAARGRAVKDLSDETPAVVKGALVFGLSGTGPELAQIVEDAGFASSAGGAENGGPDADAAKQAMQEFIDAYAKGDAKALCAMFSRGTLKQSDTFCDPNSIFYDREPSPEAESYQISEVTVSGDTATATVTDGSTEKVGLVKESGTWKIDTKLGAGSLF